MRVKWLAAVAAAVALVGCGKGAGSELPSPDAPAYVEVQNNNFYDMTIYVVRGGTRIRLGLVNGNTTQMFQIPRIMVNPGTPIRFQADPVGSTRAPYSQEIGVHPGDTITLRIPPS